MAVKVAGATGNFTAAGSWHDTVGGTLTNVTSTAVTTSYLYGANYSSLGETVAAVLLNTAAIGGTSGTLDVVLRKTSATATDIATTTINLSDINAAGNGWFVVSWGAQTLTSGQTYTVGVRRSAGASTLSLFSGASNAWNYTFLLNAASGAAPAATDDLYICGVKTGAGAATAYTVTMDDNASATYGKVYVGENATLAWKTSAATELKHSGDFIAWAGSTVSIGTSGTKIATGIVAKLSPQPASAVSCGITIKAGATWTAYHTDTKSFYSTLLGATMNASTNTCTTTDSTGWKNGDVVAIAGTTRTARQTELLTLSGDASGTTLNFTGNSASQHLGTISGVFDTRAEVVNLTRPIRITSGTAFAFYISIENTAVVTLRDCMIGNPAATAAATLGSATASKRGIDIATTTGTCDIQNCSVGGSTVASCIAFNVTGASGNSGVTISNNNIVNLVTGGSQIAVIVATTTGAPTISGNVALNVKEDGNGIFRCSDLGTTWSNNRAADASNTAFFLSDASPTGVFSGNIGHSTASHVFTVSTLGSPGQRFTMLNCSAWRGTGAAIGFSGNNYLVNVKLDGFVAFGNSVGGISIGTTNGFDGVDFANCTFDAGTGETQPSGIVVASSGGHLVVTMVNTTFGATNAHATADINVGLGCLVQVRGNNVNLASTTKINNQASMSPSSFVNIEDFAGTTGDNRSYGCNGTILRNTANAESPNAQCTELQPNIAANNNGGKLEQRYYIPVDVSTARSITVRMKTWNSYNGNNPGLTLNFLGVAAVPRAAQAVTTSWADYSIVLTSGMATEDGVVELVVDCDGSVGSVGIQKVSWT